MSRLSTKNKHENKPYKDFNKQQTHPPKKQYEW